MRNYDRIEKYLDKLAGDIYAQPPDPSHTAWANAAVDWMIPGIESVSTVLDIGCGAGFMQEKFESLGMKYSGLTASPSEHSKGGVRLGDMTFLSYEDNSKDMIFARHVLEHSPFPILTLMEWRRVAKKYLFLIAPTPIFWNYGGKNHYSVAGMEQLWWWLRRAGWKIVGRELFYTDNTAVVKNYADNRIRLATERELIPYPGAVRPIEYWLLCEKGPEIVE